MMATGQPLFTRGVSFVIAALTISYPFLIYSGWERVNPRWLLGGAILLFGLRFFLVGQRGDSSPWKAFAWPWVLPLGFLLMAFVWGRQSLCLYWPVVVSAALLLTFGRTLISPPSLVERFARLQKSELTPEEIMYCRRVTQLWCLFFVVNAAIAGVLAQGGSLRVWTLYNGLISYLLVGGFMALEYTYRHWRFRPKGALLTTWIDRWSR
jgi:uncharacterized membrane protein